MASGRNGNSAMGLSLTGSQIGSLSGLSSSGGVRPKRPGSAAAKVPNKSGMAASREKSSSMNSLNLSGSSTQISAKSKNVKPSSPVTRSKPESPKPSSRRDMNSTSARSSSSKHSNDFLALFETNHQPKVKGKSTTPSKCDWYGKSTKPSAVQGLPTKAKPAWLVGPRGDHSADLADRTTDRDRAAPQYENHEDVLDLEYLSPEEVEETLHLDTNSHSPEMNNRSSMALSPSTKTAFVDIENAYQNITHKQPVNQVHGGSMLSLPPRNGAEDYMQQILDESASKIQRWYRRISQKRRARQELLSNTGALKRLLEQKRHEHEQLLRDEEEREFERIESDIREQESRRQQRDKKAKQQRQSAIQDLKRRRSDKDSLSKEVAEREIADMKAEGKLTKNKRANKTGSNKQRAWSQDGESKERARVSVEEDPLEGVSWTTPAKVKSPRDHTSSRGSTSPRVLRADDLSPRDSESRGQPVTSRQSSRGGSKTTMEDIFNTLKQLEADEQFTERRPQDKRMAWLDDLDKQSDGSGSGPRANNPRDKHRSRDSPRGSTRGGVSDDSKLQSIMSFLDQVDTEQRITQIEQMSARTVETVPLVPSSDEIAQLEQVSRDAGDVTAAMLSQRMELDESKRSMQMLQRALNQQRELTVRHAKETDREMRQRLSQQKDEYEETIKRHLGFIDQLIDDKKNLGDRCEMLVREMKTVEKKFTDKFKNMQDSHDVELRKLKDVQAAAEKLRREKWIDEKTKKIKEMTVKGLEPEIQRLIAKHKAEMKRIKSLHEAELLEADERAGQKYVRMTEELRDQLHSEKEAACARERELAKQRYEKQIEQEEESFQVQRRRLYAEVQEEKGRLNKQASTQRAELDALQKQLEDSHGHSVSVMRQEYEKARDEQERRHAAEIKDHQERLRIEKESWEENYMKKQETWLMTKERELKERVRKDRDKEIEMVIERLEHDTVSAREECERIAENKIKRIRDKYESEIVDLERSERIAMEKYNEMKGRLTEVEGNNEQYKVLIKQKEREKGEIMKMMEKLNSERDRVSDIIRQEFADRLVITDEENKRLKNEMSELRARHRVELENVKSEIEQINKAKEEEMEEVHKRVKTAISKKEDVVQQLKQQYDAAIKRADHLEGLLEQQRKQLLKR